MDSDQDEEDEEEGEPITDRLKQQSNLYNQSDNDEPVEINRHPQQFRMRRMSPLDLIAAAESVNSRENQTKSRFAM
jgi:hypothetical protein